MSAPKLTARHYHGHAHQPIPRERVVLDYDARFLRLPDSAELAMVALNKLIQSYRT